MLPGGGGLELLYTSSASILHASAAHSNEAKVLRIGVRWYYLGRLGRIGSEIEQAPRSSVRSAQAILWGCASCLKPVSFL